MVENDVDDALVMRYDARVMRDELRACVLGVREHVKWYARHLSQLPRKLHRHRVPHAFQSMLMHEQHDVLALGVQL
jgi:hypothetical protein